MPLTYVDVAFFLVLSNHQQNTGFGQDPLFVADWQRRIGFWWAEQAQY